MKLAIASPITKMFGIVTFVVLWVGISGLLELLSLEFSMLTVDVVHSLDGVVDCGVWMCGVRTVDVELKD